MSMKYTIFFICFLFLRLNVISQIDIPSYDKAMADSLGGDDFGMKSYILVILKTGVKKINRQETEDSLFKGHIDNMVRLTELKKLVVAGPIKTNSLSYRGIFILNVRTLEEAKALLATDPVVNAGLLDVELFQWYGSAALPEYLKSHEKIQKKKM
jgi:uncharacterized protein YciI